MVTNAYRNASYFPFKNRVTNPKPRTGRAISLYDRSVTVERILPACKALSAFAYLQLRPSVSIFPF